MTVPPHPLVAAVAFCGLTSAINFAGIRGYFKNERGGGPGERLPIETLALSSGPTVERMWKEAVLENPVLPSFVKEGIDNPVLRTNIKEALLKDDEVQILIDQS